MMLLLEELWLIIFIRSSNGQTIALNASKRPAIVIAGVDKGGTTDAWNLLLSATATATATTKRRKELGCLLRSSPSRCYDALLRKDEGLTIDATPSYMYGWLVGTDTALRLKQTSPSATIIFMLREPIARLRSLYNHWSQDIAISTRRLGSGFLEDHVLTELQFFMNNSDLFKQFLASGLYHTDVMATYRSIFHAFSIYAATLDATICDKIRDSLRSTIIQNSCPVYVCFLLISCYAPFLRHWLYYFPNQLVIIQSETYFRDRTILPKTLHLGHLSTFVRTQQNKIPVANKGYYNLNSSVSKLSNATEQKLRHHILRPANAALLNFLEGGVDFTLMPPLSSWSWLSSPSS